MMFEENFSPKEFIERLGKYNNITFAEAASQSLKNIMDKLLGKDDESKT